ncbi:MAG TPA: hypothetical protein VGI77_13920 [Gaiellaceae bacterium]|jgi:hypothetical protein
MNGTVPNALVDADQVQTAASRLYDAETALHAARQTHVDAWIAAAGDRLHDAVAAYLSARALHPSNGN